MKIRSTIAAGTAIALISAPLAVAGATTLLSAPSVVAQQAVLSVAGEGEGTLSLAGRPNQIVTFVTVASRPNRTAEIALRLADGHLMKWTGQLVRLNATEAGIRLTGAGMADATGNLTVRYRGNQLISLIGNGTIDGQAMSIRFTVADDSVNRPPTTGTSMTFAQMGQGVFGLQGRPNRVITFASLNVQPSGQAELSVRLDDGSLVSFGGQQTRKDAYEIVLNLTSSGMADARGTANVRYGANNAIKGIVANGTLDGQTFFIQFNGQ
ncbi:hypothetical protein [Trichothermofontia sp.]